MEGYVAAFCPVLTYIGSMDTSLPFWRPVLYILHHSVECVMILKLRAHLV